MKIVWDEPKRRTTLASRGLDFADVTATFFTGALIIRARDGRWKAVGEFGGLVLAVILEPLGTQALSIVSMRPASRKERAAHVQAKTPADQR